MIPNKESDEVTHSPLIFSSSAHPPLIKECPASVVSSKMLEEVKNLLFYPKAILGIEVFVWYFLVEPVKLPESLVIKKYSYRNNNCV